MAHGVGPRARRPHQVSKTAGSWRRKALEYRQSVHIKFVDGEATQADLTDAEHWVRAAYIRSHLV